MIVTRNFSLIYIRRHIQICAQNIGRKKPVERRGKFPESQKWRGTFACARNRYFSQIAVACKEYCRLEPMKLSMFFSPFKLAL